MKIRSTLAAAALGATALVPLAAQPAVAAPAGSAPTTFGTFVSDDGGTVVRLDRAEVRKLRVTPVGAVPGGGVANPFLQQWRVNWGVVTGTIYFNKRETTLMTSLGTIGTFAALLPPPFGTLIAINAARIASTAAVARYHRRCLQVKSNAYVGSYSGAWCSGSY